MPKTRPTDCIKYIDKDMGGSSVSTDLPSVVNLQTPSQMMMMISPASSLHGAFNDKQIYHIQGAGFKQLLQL